MDAAAFNLFGSLLVFGSLFLMAQSATRTNPQILQILLNSNKFGREFDSAKYSDPERVTRLIICGGFARGFLHRDDVDHQKQSLELSRALIRQGWGSDKEAYRQWFTSQFIPEATRSKAAVSTKPSKVSSGS